MFDHAHQDNLVRDGGPDASDAARSIRPDLTIVVPTRNEAENIGPLLHRLTAVAGTRRSRCCSSTTATDDTPESHPDAAALRARPVRLLHRAGRAPRRPRRRGGGGAPARPRRLGRGHGRRPAAPAGAGGAAGRRSASRGTWTWWSRAATSATATSGGLAGGYRHAVSGAGDGGRQGVFPRRLATAVRPDVGLLRRAAGRARPGRAATRSGSRSCWRSMVRQPRLRVAEVPFALRRPRTPGRARHRSRKACGSSGICCGCARLC